MMAPLDMRLSFPTHAMLDLFFIKPPIFTEKILIAREVIPCRCHAGETGNHGCVLDVSGNQSTIEMFKAGGVRCPQREEQPQQRL
jgi:hypothetical protein